MTLSSLISKLEQAEKLASEAPWHIGWCNENSDAVTVDAPDLSTVCEIPFRKNQAFICEMRNSLPTLLKILRVQREALTFVAGADSGDGVEEFAEVISASKYAIYKVDALAQKGMG